MVQAKTPEEMVKVADQFPHTDQQIIALLGAASASFTARDFTAATTDYQRILNTTDVAPDLRDSAEIGLASTLEAAGKPGDAIQSYLDVAHRGAKSPYAPYAYSAVARLYEQQGDKTHAGQTLGELAGMDPSSPFVKEAQEKLRSLSAPSQPGMSFPVSAPTPPPAPSH